MVLCTLYPPNSQQLSENVIAGVILRKRRGNQIDGGNSIDQPRRDVFDSNSEVGQVAPPHRKKLRTERAQTLTIKRIEREESNFDPTRRSAESTASIAELLVLGKALERERRRVNQARFRKKQNDTLARLEKETQALRLDIETLTNHRRALSPGFQSTTNIWSMALKYFQFSNESTSSLQSPIEKSSLATAQQAFLEAAMEPDVVFNAEQGCEAILRSWRFFSSCFGNLEVELQGMQKETQNSIVVTTTTYFTFTSNAVCHAFPNLMDGGKSPLVSKLLNQRISLQGWTRFEWDRATGRVTSVVNQSDFFTPLLRILGTLEDVSTVFDGALVTVDFQLKTKQ